MVIEWSKREYPGKSSKSQLQGCNQIMFMLVASTLSLIGITFSSHYTLSHENLDITIWFVHYQSKERQSTAGNDTAASLTRISQTFNVMPRRTCFWEHQAKKQKTWVIKARFLFGKLLYKHGSALFNRCVNFVSFESPCLLIWRIWFIIFYSHETAIWGIYTKLERSSSWLAHD